MRIVTMKDFETLRSALAELDQVTQSLSAQSHAAHLQVQALANAGQIEQAESLGLKEIAKLNLAYSACTAKFQEAVVAFLGEKRSALETMDGYSARIAAVLNDLPAMLAMQQRNGLVFRL